MDAKAASDAYGVAVRAGVITPQTDDEEAFRKRLSLPPMSSDAKAACRRIRARDDRSRWYSRE
jgi:hypothetical protein